MRKVIIAEGNLGRGDQVLIPPKTKRLIGEFVPNRTGSLSGTVVRGSSTRSVTIRPKLPVSVDASSTHLIVLSCQYLEALYAELP